jgi:hypothetical protein
VQHCSFEVDKQGHTDAGAVVEVNSGIEEGGGDGSLDSYLVSTDKGTGTVVGGGV